MRSVKQLLPLFAQSSDLLSAAAIAPLPLILLSTAFPCVCLYQHAFTIIVHVLSCWWLPFNEQVPTLPLLTRGACERPLRDSQYGHFTF